MLDCIRTIFDWKYAKFLIVTIVLTDQHKRRYVHKRYG
jgi:hypothetical protein